MKKHGLWDAALKLLGGRALSLGEIRAKLRAKAANPADVDKVIQKLKGYGLLDDAKFAERYATARRDNQGFGRFRVVQDLRKRRVAPQLAETAAAGVYADTDEVELAAQYLLRKYRGKDLSVFLREEKNMASAYRRLRMGGFGSGTAIRVLKRYSSQADQLESCETEVPDPGDPA